MARHHLRRCIELFACGGGSAEGLRQAGIRHLAAVEWDPVSCATLRAAGFPVVQVDAWDYEVPAGLWMVWASPPCQPYSRNGLHKGEEDSRDCWPIVMRAARNRPTWLIVENVVGAPVDDWRWELLEIYPHVTRLRLNARDFGVPQNREREFLIAGPDVVSVIPTGEASMEQVVPSLTGKWVRQEQRGSVAQPASWFSSTITTKRNAYVFDANPGPRPGKGYKLPATARILSLSESAAIQGFPPDYPFAGTQGQKQKQIGNAVPPALATAVVEACKVVLSRGARRQ